MARYCATIYIFLLYWLGIAWPAVPISVSNFYSFGSSTGDSQLSKNDDGSSGLLDISIAFPYFDRNHDKLYVNTNGVISFLNQVSEFTPEPFPLGNNRRLLTPFWADVDTRKGGYVWYRESTDRSLLNRVSIDIRKAFLSFSQFTPTWLYVATWDKVAFYGSNSTNNHKRNTFQAVLATNGRHSFVIYNYARIEWLAGTASHGKPAQCGFNAGDGKRYFIIPGSRTDAVLNLPTTSNVNRPGVWMFRVDSVEIQSQGCNTKGKLTVSPRKALMLGGENIYIAGPCFTKDDAILCDFGDKKKIRGSLIDEVIMRAKCVAPMVDETGRIYLKVSIDNGKTYAFQGFFHYVNVIRNKPSVRRSLPDQWAEGKQVRIQWDAKRLGDSSKPVTIDMVKYKMKSGEVKLDGFTTISTQHNTGTSTITLPSESNIKENSDHRSVSILRVKKNAAQASNDDSPNEWIWSDVFSAINSSIAPARCNYWHSNEPEPNHFIEDSSLLPCPQSLLQALVDRGSYVPEETCDGKNREACEKYHPQAKQCVRTARPSSKGAGQQCCYNTKGNLMSSHSGAGHLDRAHINTDIPYISHYFHDIMPYHECCLLSNNCDDYYEKRPSDDGSNYEPPRAASGVGDPHMVTLDGVEYTFNGYGEYTLLKIEANGFYLQGRMEPLPPRNGIQIKATVYTAFAMKENGSDVIEIRLNGRGFVEVAINGEIQDFDDEQTTDFKNVIVMKESNSSKYSVIFNSGIAVIVEGFSNLLQFTIMMPNYLKGNTSGLLGYWNDDKEQEFLLPNGLFVNTSSNTRSLHYEFGLKWSTQAYQSLFTYGPGKSYQSYYNPQFQPVFIDLNNIVFDDPVLERTALSTCGDSIQCLFDVKATGDTSIGLSTKNSIQQLQVIINTTETKGCVPLDASFTDGFYQRNDSDRGITYRYKCNQGFIINGPSVLSCTHGEWNGTTPTCLPLKECPPLLVSHHAAIVYTNETLVSTAKFTCSKGFRLIGPSMIICTKLNGTWNAPIPKCKIINTTTECAEVTSSNANTTYNETEEHVTAYFSCIHGYMLVGPQRTICTKSNGTWNRSPPSCQLVGPVEHQFDSKGKSKALVIGVTLSVFFVLICGFFIGWFIIYKRKPNPKHSHESFGMKQDETRKLTEPDQSKKVKVVYL